MSELSGLNEISRIRTNLEELINFNFLARRLYERLYHWNSVRTLGFATV